MNELMVSIDELATRVPDGAVLALPPDYSGCAISVVRALIERRVRQLNLVGLPQLGLQADMLIGAGVVATVETAAVTLGEYGLAPCFSRAVAAGTIRLRDSTCPAIHAGLQASEKGVPFMPIRGIIGSDLIAHRADWKVIDNPFGEDDPIVLVAAITPDIALFHAPIADRDGNVWIGVRRELMLAAHASKATLVSVEEVVDDNLLDDPKMAPGTIPSLYIDAIAEAPNGARPVGLWGCYPADGQEMERYVSLARSDDGLSRFLRV